MAERSALYRLLSEIYFFFDVMDLEGFGSFLRRYPMALNNQSLKYNLIDNLLARSLKTDNENTCEVLAEFIQLIENHHTHMKCDKYMHLVINVGDFKRDIDIEQQITRNLRDFANFCLKRE